MKNKGSVLITSLWMMSIFSIFTASIAFEAAEHAALLGREIQNLDSRIDFFAGLRSAAETIFADPEPHEDSLSDAWQGLLKTDETSQRKSLGVRVEDEEAKINLNAASENLLETFLKEFETENQPLKTDRRELVKQIVKRRAKHSIDSLAELYLLEDVDAADIKAIKPFVTVSCDLPGINLNTAPPLVLGALIHSLTGDDLAKGRLLEKISEFRQSAQALRSEDLTPNPFIRKLKLEPSFQTLVVVNQLLGKMTTDSRTFRVTLRSPSGKQAQAILRESGLWHTMQIREWQES